MNSPFELLACLVCGTMTICLMAAVIAKQRRWPARWRHATGFAWAYSWVAGGVAMVTTVLVIGPDLLLLPVVGMGAVSAALGWEALKTTNRRMRAEAFLGSVGQAQQ